MEAEHSTIGLPSITIQPPSPRSNTTEVSSKTDVNQNCNIPDCDNSQICADNETRASDFGSSPVTVATALQAYECGLSNEQKQCNLHNQLEHKSDLTCGINYNSSTIEASITYKDVTMKDLTSSSDSHISHARQSSATSDSSGEFINHTDYVPHCLPPKPSSSPPLNPPMDTSESQRVLPLPINNGNTHKMDSISVNGFMDGNFESSNGRNLSTKSNSLGEADLKDRERPTVQRRGSKKSMNSVVVNDSDSAFAERREEMMTIRRRSESVLEYKEHAHSRLQDELLLAQQELKLKDDECKKLTRIREQMSEEIEELTASLFEEANKMVQDAHIKRMQSEKLLKEANSKIDMLQAEVTALKTLVITSTPSAPNPHLNPQITATQDTTNHKKPEKFVKGHRRSTSHHNISREISLTELKLPRPGLPGTTTCGIDGGSNMSQTQREIDPEFFKLFQAWRTKPTLSHTCPLLKALFREDIMPCMAFANQELAKSVLESVINNTLNIEPVQEKDMYRKCVLTQCNSICKHRVKLKDGESFIYVSHIARNRVAAVCDLFTYLRYIVQGLVKSNEKDIYWEVIRLRKQMCLAKLGYVS